MERVKTKTEILDDLLSIPTPDYPGESVLLIEELFENIPDKRTRLFQTWKEKINTLIKQVNQYHYPQKIYNIVK